MLHGQTYPVTRNYVQLGQAPINGDIVLIGHKHSIKDKSCLWHICEQCGYLWDLPCENGTHPIKPVMPDYLAKADIWDAPDYPVSPDEEEYMRYLDKQNSILKTRERRRCYTCGESGTGRMRHVIGHFTASPNFDPTLAYRLDCGHTTIDC